jgi:hypothetical protein
VDPVLAAGEMGLETDTYRIKVGNGLLSWNSLPYALQQDLQQVTTFGSTTNVAVSFTNSNVSSNSATGAVTVAGGVGIGGNLNVGDNLLVVGNATANAITANNYVSTNLVLGNATVVNVDTASVIIDSFATSAYSTAKYIVRASNGSDYHSMEAFLVNDGVAAFLTVYASVHSNVKLISLSADISAGLVQLKATGSVAGNSVKVFATRI